MNTSLLSASKATAQTVPVRTFQFNGWERLPFQWRGQSVYVNLSNGEWAYEADGERLVELPSEVVHAILDIRLLDFAVQEMSPEAREMLKRRGC